MNRGAPILGAGAAVALLGGCAAGPELQVPIARDPGRHLDIWSTHAEDAGNTVLVRGIVKRRPLDRCAIWGHLHLEARFNDGRPPVAAVAYLGSVPVRGARSTHFAARLPIADAGTVTQISITYAADRHRRGAKSGLSA